MSHRFSGLTAGLTGLLVMNTAGMNEVRVRRVLAGSVGGEDYLLIRTRGVAAVCRGPGRGEPLQVEEIAASALRPGDLVLVEAGQVIPRDGEILEGACALDESAATGVSSPVLHEAGGPRAGVLGGTRVVSGRVVVRVHAGQDGAPAGPPGS
jgi:cation transport ATPase